MTPNLLAVCCGSSVANADIYAAHLTAAMDRFEINTPSRQAALLATIAIESERLRKVEEGLYYTTADRLREVYPSLFGPRGQHRAEDYLRSIQGLSNLRYNGFHGRGLIQLTWLDAYSAAGSDLGYDYVHDPGLVKQPLHAALTACWFFAQYRKCLAPADAGDMYTVTGLVNGPARLQLAERKAQYLVALKALQAAG